MATLIGALLAVALLGIALLLALSAKGSLESARAQLDALTSEDLPVGVDAIETLRSASQEVQSARRQLDNPVVRLVAAVPLLGRSWDAERAVARLADEVLDAAVVGARLVTDVEIVGGAVDLAALDEIRVDLEAPVARSEQALARLEEVGTAFTPAPVGRAVADALEALGPAVDGLRQATSALESVHGVLGGEQDRTVFVALANNAELRGSGGYVSSFATGSTSGGRLELDPLQDLIALADPPGAAVRVPAPEDFVVDFGPLAADTTQFRSWNMSPDFPDAAQVAAVVAGRLLGREPDVIVLIDVPALTALARLGGAEVPVEGGRVVSPEELQEALLIDAYAGAGADTDAQIQRRQDLQAAASTAVTQLLSADVPLEDTLRTVRDLTRGRHLVIWSRVPDEQTALEDLGVSGGLDVAEGGDLVHVSVNNLGANKLDVYVDREVEVDAEVFADRARVSQRVTFRNQAPDDLVPYVAGTERPGTAVSRVEFSLSPAAEVEAVLVDGVPVEAVVRGGPDRQRVALRVEVPRAAELAVEVRYALPVVDGRYAVDLVPQALAVPASLDVRVEAADAQLLQRQDGDEPARSEHRLTAPFDASVSLVLAPPVVERTWRVRLDEFWNEPLEIG